MKEEKDGAVCCDSKKSWNGSGGAVYGLGFIGAAVYFIGHATTFWIGVVGVGKAIIWPAILIYKALEFFYK